MPVARNNLCRDGLGRQAHLLRNVCLDARIDVGEGADRARKGAGRDLLAGRNKPFPRTVELRIRVGELQSERDGLSMDAVAAADGGRSAVFDGATLDGGEEIPGIGDEEIGGAHELDVEAGIEHIRRRHALVNKARLGANDLGEVGEKGDDVVFCLALDSVDAIDVEGGVAALFPDALGGLAGDDAQLGHGGGGMRFDLEPDAEACLGVPDGSHLRAAVARNHVVLVERWGRSHSGCGAVGPWTDRSATGMKRSPSRGEAPTSTGTR